MNSLRETVGKNIMEAYKRVAHVQFLHYVKNVDFEPIVECLFKLGDSSVSVFVVRFWI
jgi:hypothetical protein